MANLGRTLPDYIDPPVIETVLSIQFAPLQKLSIPHFGLYWNKIRQEFSRFEVHPPIGSIKEEFDLGAGRGIPAPTLQFVPQPILRCWFIDESGNRVLQVQNDRFIHNWRKITGDEKYPHYETTRPKFEEEWLRFCAFLKAEGLGIPDVNQCEVTYVNHIEYTEKWKSYGELNKVISCWSGSSSETFLPSPERVNLSISYVFPHKQGRLHVAMLPVLRTRDGEEVLQLSLTARGRPASSNVSDVFGWLDLGREWIVKGFTDFTTPEMHKIWRRTI